MVYGGLGKPAKNALDIAFFSLDGMRSRRRYERGGHGQVVGTYGGFQIREP
jgi:hypothetical protein